MARGAYAQAEPLFYRAMAIDEKVLGPEHQRVGTTLSNLARLYDSQGQYAKGQPLWSDSFTANVQNEYRGKTSADSVYRASGVYLQTSPPVPALPNAATLRITLSPTAGGPFHLLDAWLMPR